MHPSQLASDKRYREKQKKLGNVRVSVLIPENKVMELKEIASKMRNQPDRICQFCSYVFPDKCGKYGCPNCNGEGVAEE
jgi:hypothetical protein